MGSFAKDRYNETVSNMCECARIKILPDIDVSFLFKISLTLLLTFKARS